MLHAQSDYRPSTDANSPAPRCLSGADVAAVVISLVELRELTLSRSSYERADRLIQILGGSSKDLCSADDDDAVHGH